MKNRLAKYILAGFGFLGAALSGLVGYQKFCLRQAQKKKDETYLLETYETEEGAVAYRSLGHGRPLLLVHSVMAGASLREWDAVIDELAETYHVYAMDLPGFGNSFCPKEPWTAYQYARFLHLFITDVVKRPVCICGANAGADFALTLQHLYPDQVRRMILISPEGIGRGFATDEDTKPLSLLLSPVAGTQKFLLGTSKAAIKKQLEAAFYAKEQVSAELIQRYANAARYGAHAQTTFADISTRFYAADTKAAFAALEPSVPFLMIWGEENKENPVEHFNTAEKMKTHGAFALFEQTAMLPHMENSRAFLENTKEFLK